MDREQVATFKRFTARETLHGAEVIDDDGTPVALRQTLHSANGTAYRYNGYWRSGRGSIAGVLGR